MCDSIHTSNLPIFFSIASQYSEKIIERKNPKINDNIKVIVWKVQKMIFFMEFHIFTSEIDNQGLLFLSPKLDAKIQSQILVRRYLHKL